MKLLESIRRSASRSHVASTLVFAAMVSCSSSNDRTTDIALAAEVDKRGCSPASVVDGWQWPDVDPEVESLLASVDDIDVPPDFEESVPAVEPHGRVEGTASVEQGAARYTIPIEVAPGRVGATPSLALTYDSGGGNGVVGVGWNVAGTSRVHRCVRTVAQDGYVAPVRYDASDALCLDGRRLVLYSGAYGRSGAEYRTEVDTFARVRQSGEMDDAATCFTVEAKDGTVSTYGGCVDATASFRPGASRNGAPLYWSLDVRADRQGNEVDYDYQILGGEQHLLTSIHYTGYQGVPGDRVVRLEYDGRPDAERSYLAGEVLVSSHRLASITSYVAATVARRYELSYEVGLATGRSRLSQVDTCAAASCEPNNSLPPTTFAYADGGALHFATNMAAFDPDTERRWPVADLDGDGRDDWVVITYPEPWGGSPERSELHLTTRHTLILESSPWPSAFDPRSMRLQRVDYDLDGMVELEGIYDASGAPRFAIASWDPTTLSFSRVMSSDLDLGNGVIVGRADFDADGRPDLLVQENGALTAHLQCEPYGASATAPLGMLRFCRSVAIGTATTCEAVYTVADFDGNGRADVVIEDSPAATCHSYDTRIAFVQDDLSVVSARLSDMNGPSKLYQEGSTAPRRNVTDLNGDGLPDILETHHANAWRAWLNRGGDGAGATAFVATNIASPPRTAPAHAYRSVMSGDFDGDGQDELLLPVAVTAEFCQSVAPSGGATQDGGLSPVGACLMNDIAAAAEEQSSLGSFASFALSLSRGSGGYEVQHESTSDVWAGRGKLKIPCYEVDPVEYCSSAGTSERTFSGRAGGMDRAVYRWDLVDFRPDPSVPGGIAAVTRSTDLEAPLGRSDVVDRRGDGLADVQFLIADTWAQTAVDDFGQPTIVPLGHYRSGGPGNGHYTAYNAGTRPDLLVGATDGFGRVARFHYSALADGGHADCGADAPFYTVDAASTPRDGIHALIDTRRHVVARLERSNGVGGDNATCYRYENGWRDIARRGFLTFGSITEDQHTPAATDPDNDLRLVRRFEREFPLSGLVAMETTARISEPTFPIARTTNAWSASCQSGRCFVALDRTQTDSFDLASHRLLATVLEEHWYDDAEHGNRTLTRTTRTDDHHTQVVRIDPDYDYDYVDQWWIDKLESVTQTWYEIDSAAEPRAPGVPGGKLEQVRTYDYYTAGPSRRLVKYEHVQTGVSGQAWSAYHQYDQYGNEVYRQESADGAPARTSGRSFGADGYFEVRRNNAAGHTVATETDARHGKLTRITDPNRLVTTLYYDDFGRVIARDEPGAPRAYERVLACDASCPLFAVARQVRMQPGAPTTTTYLDSELRTVRVDTTTMSGTTSVSTQFDARGRVIAESAPHFAGQPPLFTRYRDFDALSRVGTKDVEQTSGAVITTRYAYDGYDTTIALPGSKPLVRTHDSAGRLLRVVDATGSPTEYRYDPRGQLALIRDPAGNETRLHYDDLGRQVTTDDPDRGVTTARYDGFGQVRTQVDANGTRMDFDYDAIGRPTARYVDGDLEAEWAYDMAFDGRLDYERGGTEGVDGFCRGYEYDSLSRETRSVTFVDGLALATQTVYDGNFGRAKAVASPSGRVTALSYDSYGRPTAERDPASGIEYRRTRAIDALGNVTHEDFGNGLMGLYTYDPVLAQATRLLVTDAGPEGYQTSVVQDLRYHYDHPAGFLATAHNAVTGAKEQFGYDDLYRLDWSEVSPPSGSSQRIDYDYDSLGNLVRKDDYSWNTAYGSGDRRNPANAGPHGIVSYRAASGQTVVGFVYDDAGNLLHGDGRAIEYDAHHKPVRIDAGGAVVGLAYGPDTERYKRTEAGKVTHYVGDSYERIETGGAIVEKDYIGDKVVVTRTAGRDDLRYLHPDRLGSAAVVTAAQRDPIYSLNYVLERQGFAPFGGPRDGDWQPTGLPPVNTTERGFTGHEHIDASELVHMKGRAYDYRLGRFVSVDPFIVEPMDPQSVNAYSYVRNNPIQRIDPTGYEDEELKAATATTSTATASKVKTRTSSSAPDKQASPTVSPDMRDQTVGDNKYPAEKTRDLRVFGKGTVIPGGSPFYGQFPEALGAGAKKLTDGRLLERVAAGEEVSEMYFIPHKYNPFGGGIWARVTVTRVQVDGLELVATIKASGGGLFQVTTPDGATYKVGGEGGSDGLKGMAEIVITPSIRSQTTSVPTHVYRAHRIRLEYNVEQVSPGLVPKRYQYGYKLGREVKVQPRDPVTIYTPRRLELRQ